MEQIDGCGLSRASCRTSSDVRVLGALLLLLQRINTTPSTRTTTAISTPAATTAPTTLPAIFSGFKPTVHQMKVNELLYTALYIVE